MAKEILAQIQSALETKTLQVVLAGGAADWIGSLPPGTVRGDPDLTFRGMLAIARRNA